MAAERVVVTGLGAITCLGFNAGDFYQALVEGRSGVKPITRFDTSQYPVKIAAQVENFDPLPWMDIKVADRNGRFIQHAIAASLQAARQARLEMKLERPERVGVTIATTGEVHRIGEGAEVLKTRGPRRIDPLFINRISPHMAPVQVGRVLGAMGPTTSVNSACAGGSDAIGTALTHLQAGHADVMLAGGTDTLISDISIAVMGLVGALSKDPVPEGCPRPFDLTRNGFVAGEGCGMLALETLEHARRRGATILCELAGVGWSADAHDDTAPMAEGMALAIKMALESAGLKPEDVSYINAHGTGTRLNDAAETKAIKLVMGVCAPGIPVSSNKSMIGHLGGAAGAVEAVATVMTLLNGVIPPTINYKTPDPECDLDYVPNTARKADLRVCISNSFGLGGQNASVLFKRWEG
jgi:3-oxoacyl-[acyl-carrier-protein] synthase II